MSKSISGYLDTLTLHRLFGPIIFLAVMYAMFAFAINFGGYLQLWVDQTSEAIFVTGFSDLLHSLGFAQWAINLLAFGLGRGINITVTFVPVLSAMFLSLGVLEGSGYMHRAAYIVDRLMRVVGLSGKSFVPLIVGFGCNVPAIIGTRSIPNQRERLLTVLMAPFMSCGARLAIYAIFVAAFFPVGGQNVIFSLYIIGILAAIATGFLLRTHGKNIPVMMSITDMPAYRLPKLKNLARQIWRKVISFLFGTGKIIIILSLILNGIGYELLEALGKFITPIFIPIGITVENWPATLGLLTGMVGKEAVIGTLNTYYLNEDMLIQGFGGPIAAYAYLLFTLLYFPCISVVASIAKELDKKWALFSVVWSTGLAYMISALFYQVASMNSLVWIAGLSFGLVGFFVMARVMVKPNSNAVPTPIIIH